MADLRILIADDERPARRFLASLLADIGGVEIAGEAATGPEAVELTGLLKPDLLTLDLQMPGLGGLDVARQLPTGHCPQIVFVTAFDDHAVAAFELNAVDYLLKPVERVRLAATLSRVRGRMPQPQVVQARLQAAVSAYDSASRRGYLERIPVRQRDDVVLVPARLVASIVADGELLHLTTTTGERHTISHTLQALEARLDPRRFIRLGRGALAAVDQIQRVTPMPGGTSEVTLANGQTLPVSRIQSRLLRDTLLRL